MGNGSETWYRGEGVGVARTTPGSTDPHDIGDGYYLTDSVEAAKAYASLRAPNHADQRVFSVKVDRSSPRILDLTNNPAWQEHVKPVGAYIKLANKNYGQTFENFIKANKIDLRQYDAVIAPDHLRGGGHMSILLKGGKSSPLEASQCLLQKPGGCASRSFARSDLTSGTSVCRDVFVGECEGAVSRCDLTACYRLDLIDPSTSNNRRCRRRPRATAGGETALHDPLRRLRPTGRMTVSLPASSATGSPIRRYLDRAPRAFCRYCRNGCLRPCRQLFAGRKQMDAKTVSAWGSIIVSVVALATFTGALVVSFFFKDSGLLNLTVGAAIANATTAVGFWLGSSSGSQKKDDVIGAALASSPGAAADGPGARATGTAARGAGPGAEAAGPG
jgi:hypothetical protein